LGAMCVFNQVTPLFSQGHGEVLRQVTLALLAESISREARIYEELKGKTTGDEKLEVIRTKIMSIKENDCPTPLPDDKPEPKDMKFDTSFSEGKCRKACEKLLNESSRTNASPLAVETVMIFAHALHSQILPRDVGYGSFEALMDELEKGKEEQIETKIYQPIKKAFTFHYGQEEPNRGLSKAITLVGLTEKRHAFREALVIQALRYNSSKDRRDLKLDLANPAQFLAETAADCRKLKYEEKLAEKNKRLNELEADRKKKERLVLAEREAKEFLSQHEGRPNLFTAADIRELNKNRPPTDQLELMPTGLLRHHCCFPKCMYYLQNLASEKDIKGGGRDGLYHHFRQFFYPNRTYIKGLHVAAMEYDSKHQNDSETVWVEGIVALLKKKAYVPQGGDQLVRKYLKDMYPQFVSLKEKENKKK